MTEGPTVARERSEELDHPRQGNHAVHVENFAAFDFAIFRFVIGVRKKLADGGHAGAAMSSVNGFLGIEAVLARPLGPNARHGGC